MAARSRLARRVLTGLARLLAACLVAAGLVGCGGSSASSEPSGPPGWRMTGSMTTARLGHAAALLANGRVLIAGGYISDGPGDLTYFASAELYDPATGTFSATGTMTAARAGCAAIALSNGRVLIAGGYFIDGSGATLALSSAELYDPASGTFSATGSMGSARYHYAAVPLGDGRVLFAGGTGADGILDSVEVYDPGTGSFGPAGSMTTGRTGLTATLLETGRVLLAGGAGNGSAYLASAELYDPASGRSAATGSMSATRYDPSAARLPNGRVLVSGGSTIDGGGNKVALASAEVFDSATGQFTATGAMAAARSGHRSVLLSNGRVLVVGGLDPHGSGAASYPTTAELYDPAGGTFGAAGSTAGRARATLTVLADDRVLIAGGGDANGVLASAELYQP